MQKIQDCEMVVVSMWSSPTTSLDKVKEVRWQLNQ